VNKVMICTLSFNRAPYTKRFLETFFKATNEPVDMIIVEQGSGQPAVDLCKKVDGKITKNGSTIKVIWNASNVGIPIALNQALALRDSSQHFMKIDNDVHFPDNYKEWLSHMVDIAANHTEKDNMGILGLSPFSNDRPRSERGNLRMITLKNGNQYQIEQWPHNLLEMGLFLSAKIATKVGGFNEKGLKYGYEGPWYQAKANCAKAYFYTFLAIHGDAQDLDEAKDHQAIKLRLLRGGQDANSHAESYSNDATLLDIEWQ